MYRSQPDGTSVDSEIAQTCANQGRGAKKLRYNKDIFGERVDRTFFSEKETENLLWLGISSQCGPAGVRRSKPGILLDSFKKISSCIRTSGCVLSIAVSHDVPLRASLKIMKRRPELFPSEGSAGSVGGDCRTDCAGDCSG